MIGLALSGGGARAIAFHLGCLRALQDLGILERINVLSTISGGSVLGAYYAYTPHLTFDAFEAEMVRQLRQGFQRQLLAQLALPSNLARGGLNRLARGADALRARITGAASLRPRYPNRTDLFARVLQGELFAELPLTAPRRHDLEAVIGACELRTGTAFRFSAAKVGSWRHGTLLEPDLPLALAVAASAAYPLLLPAIERRWAFRREDTVSERSVSLTDGGVYDNLGLSVLEPNRQPDYSLHVFPCDYLIVCSAGQGQAADLHVPNRFFQRVGRSFSIIHRRVQDAAMQRLHAMKAAGRIRGFALPYLGQQDERLPGRPADLVPRAAVIGYPTDFSAMPQAWIDQLSRRGEQLTRTLIAHYLSDLCD